MFNYILRRIAYALITLTAISMIAFAIIQLPPGDFVDVYKQQLINQGGMDPEDAERRAVVVRERYGLNAPIPVQYVNWIRGIVTKGEFGYSFSYRRDAGEIIAQRLPRTIALALAAHVISSLVGIGLGIIVGQRKYSLSDNAAAVIAFFLTSVPRFSLALIVMYLLVFQFGQQHVSSFYSPEYVLAPWSFGKFMNLLQHVWPVIVIAGLGGVARNLRVMRGNLLDTLNEQYVTTARSKGLRENTVINKHAVPNALHPILMYQGTVIPYMVQGELEVAIVFSLPTIAPLFFQSLRSQDIYITGSILLMYGVLLVVGNLVADVLLGVLDPRIRYT